MFKAKLVSVALAAVFAGTAFTVVHESPSAPRPYIVQVYGHNLNKFYKCRKLVHVAPFYGFTSCKIDKI